MVLSIFQVSARHGAERSSERGCGLQCGIAECWPII